MGNIDVQRDWGHAKEYVRMQWMMLQQDAPEGFVIATGVQYSVRQFINWTAEALSMQLRWEGERVSEVAYWVNRPESVIASEAKQCTTIEQAVVRIDPRCFRPTEVDSLLGDPTKAKEKIGWVPKITLDGMIQEMVVVDLADAQKNALLKQQGYHIVVSVE